MNLIFFYYFFLFNYLFIFINGLINLSETKCGITHAHRSRIVGGSNASPGQFPWVVSLTRQGGHFCGGFLISKRWILTAAHCMCTGKNTFLKSQSIKVSLAQHDLSLVTNEIKYELPIKTIAIHEQYECGKSANDIALIELYNDITWSNYVLPSCLWNKNQISTKDATVIGWGWLNEEHDGIRSNILQMAQVKLIDNHQCNEWYQIDNKKLINITNQQICAGFENGGIDACWADSGGPLMVKQNDQMVVIGIVSTGIGCARVKLPGIYTRLSEYLPWVQNTIS